MQTIELEKQGETLTFPARPDPAAPAVEFELRLSPGASGPAPHLHPRQSETFSVRSGRLRVKLADAEHVLEAGERLVVAPGQVHSFANGSETEPLVCDCRVEPALNFQWFLTEMARSAARANGSWDEMPLLEAAYILHNARDEYRLARMPSVVQSVLFRALAGAAVVLGRTKRIEPPGAPERLMPAPE